MIEREIQLYETRIGQFVDRLPSYFYSEQLPLEAEAALADPPLSFARRLELAYRPIAVGEKWGADWQTAWFHLTGTVPAAWQGRPVVARINLGGEGLVFAADGTPTHALSWHSLWQPEFRRDRIPIADPARGGEQVELWIEASAAQIFGLRLVADPLQEDPRRHGHLEAVVQDLTLAVFRPSVWHLWLDARLLFNQMKALPEKSVRRARLLRALMQAADRFQGDDGSTAAARALLAVELVKKSGPSDLVAHAVGHAHIDTGWLWPVSETVRKCARSFAAQIDLIERYPGYVFGASQAQHYAFVKECYPALYEKIRAKVAEGSWEIQGGMWVEADCNLIGGESMVRQILHGVRFFEQEFGITVRNLWLPDVFGYSAAMPQILQKSGLGYMVTQKISWNQFNRFPHHSFIWRGIDGSEIIVHFPPEDTYNSEFWPSGMRHAQENFAERDRLDEFLVLFGIGDGGGGATEEIIESGLRQNDLEGGPRVRFGKAQEMLNRLGARRELLQRWNGELYLELHRGTLTTQARTKFMNRWCEHKLREVEALFSALPAAEYPAAELDRLWKTVMRNQFHDILPGSSIKLVYETTRREHDEVRKELNGLAGRAGAGLLNEQEGSLTLVNTLSTPFTRPTFLPAAWIGHEILDEADRPVPVQVREGNLVALAEVPALSSVVLRRGQTLPEVDLPPEPRVSEPLAPASLEGVVLENDLILYELAGDGTIARIFDKERSCEVMLPGQSGNRISLYEDRPANWDAWDVDIYYENQLLQQAGLTGWRRLGSGPVAQMMLLQFRVGDSCIEQRLCLVRNTKRLDFVTHVHWRERHRMLRVAFDADVTASEASYEIQYGTVRRPTHRNTSWDMARFETVGHRFVDLSEPTHGVALLNNGKYGHKVLDRTIDLNLLRAPTSPDPDADRGEHDFVYSLLPHAGALEESAVYAEAARLNQPLALFEDRSGRVNFPCRLENEAAILSVLKKAEGDDAIILRLYEPRGRRASTRLLLTDPGRRVFATDLLERKIGELPQREGAVALDFGPFEIKTLKLV
ncbi:MAG TPA: glycoside hydrolase family 38 C-terminal domain-containing protein [bacterium]|nr:glycoside hydrolase family 38 C-terminal domain-containing protein [bacterium]